MLIVDGVEYRSCTPSSEAELEEFVEAHTKRIFGEDSLYFPVKTRLKSLGGVGSIPDGYVPGLAHDTVINSILNEKIICLFITICCGVWRIFQW